MMRAATGGRGRPERRLQQLQAMGIQPWRLRRPPAEVQPALAESGVGCVVLVPVDCDLRIRDLLARALQAAGPVLARAGCISMNPAQMSAPPPAAAYLLLDGRLEAAVAAARPQAVRHGLDHPQQLLDAQGKRRLWQCLRAIRLDLSMAGEPA